MKKLTLSGLLLVLLIILAWTSTGQTQAKQNTPAANIPQQKCESPFYTRRAGPGEDEQFANDPIAQNFEVTRRTSPNALMEAAERGDKSLVSYFEFNADVHSAPGELLALIKLGDDTRFNKLVNQTRCAEGGNADDYGRQVYAIQLLALLKTPAAYRALYSLLDDTTYPKSRSSDEILFSRSEIVMNELYRTVKPLPDGLNFPDGRGKPKEQQRLIWKQWFKANNLVP